jgi:murein DD-endopeptidase MepM/ murein hydrolase activator NlpD
MVEQLTFVAPVGDPRFAAQDGPLTLLILATPEDHQRLRPLRNWPSDSAVDLAVPCGFPVRAPISGRIVRSGAQGGGKYSGDKRVAIDDGNGHAVFLGHLSSIDGAAVEGTTVIAGQIIGRSGKWKDSPCHLHMGMGRTYLNQRLLIDGIDPRPWLESVCGALQIAPNAWRVAQNQATRPAGSALRLWVTIGIAGGLLVFGLPTAVFVIGGILLSSQSPFGPAPIEAQNPPCNGTYIYRQDLSTGQVASVGCNDPSVGPSSYTVCGAPYQMSGRTYCDDPKTGQRYSYPQP